MQKHTLAKTHRAAADTPAWRHGRVHTGGTDTYLHTSFQAPVGILLEAIGPDSPQGEQKCVVTACCESHTHKYGAHVIECSPYNISTATTETSTDVDTDM